MKTGMDRVASEEQVVTFRIGKEIYGIDISKIQEVLHYKKITSIPNAPDFVEGVIEVRDRLIPIIDLAKRLSVESESKGRKRIIVLDLDDKPLGIIVDDISKVLRIGKQNFEEVPEAIVDDVSQSCISKLAKVEETLIIMIKPDKILKPQEAEEFRKFDEKGIRDEINDSAT